MSSSSAVAGTLSLADPPPSQLSTSTRVNRMTVSWECDFRFISLCDHPRKNADIQSIYVKKIDVLVSLVRTKTVGHIRDVRRLIVALSRARLGLYVFGRQRLFEICHELEPAFKQLLRRPTKLWLKREERYSDEIKRLLYVPPKGDEDSDAEEDAKEGDDDDDDDEEEGDSKGKDAKGKAKGKGKKLSKKAKKREQLKHKEEREAREKEEKSYSEINGVSQIGEYVFGLQKEQQKYALKQQAAYMASMQPPVPAEENEEDVAMGGDEEDKTEAKVGSMEVDAEEENDKDE